MENLGVVLASLGPIDFKPRDNLLRARPIGEIDGKLWGVIGPDGAVAYRNLVDSVLAARGVKKNYTEKDVTQAIDLALLGIDKSQIKTDKQFVSLLKNSLPVGPSRDFTVWRHVFGVRFRRYRKLGGFIFQQTKNMKRDFKKFSFIDWEEKFGEYVVKTTVHCVSPKRALELADDRFTRLELLFALLVGPGGRGYYVRVLRPSSAHAVSHAIKSDDKATVVGDSLMGGEFNIIDLEDQFFRDTSIQRLFRVISVEAPNQIEDRLIRAIEWIGKGTISRSSSEAIICYCTAMESVLVREKKVVISPSIVSSLSEYCAFLLGKGHVQRIKIEKSVKDIYGERSAAAHGGKSIISRELLALARNLSIELVVVLSRHVEGGMKCDREMVDFIRKMKYGP